MIHQYSNSIGNYSFNALTYGKILYETHFHRNYELIYTLYGSVSVVAYDTEILLMPHEALLIAPNEPHSFKTEDNSKIWVAVFSSDYIPAFFETYRNKCFMKFRFDSSANLFLHENLFDNTNISFFDRISGLSVVCSQCVKYAKIYDRYRYSGITDKLLEYVYDNFTEDITLQSAAKHFGYEYHYLSALFNKCFFLNFSEFVNICRFNMACELILKTDKKFSDIALESGFGSMRSFNRVFKKHAKKTPKQFKRDNKINNDSIVSPHTDSSSHHGTH